MNFTEAVARFAQTKPVEMPEGPASTVIPPAKRKRRMSKEPKSFVFTLSFEEAALIMGATGSGGHQELHRRITGELEKNNNQVMFDDQQLGELIRYMTRYGSGGFQVIAHPLTLSVSFLGWLPYLRGRL